MRGIAIALILCGLFAAALAWSTGQLQFATWVRFSLVAFAAVYLFNFFKNRARGKGQLNGDRG